MLPGWTMDGGPGRLAEILNAPKERARLREEMRAGNRLGRPEEGWLTNFQQPHNVGYEGRSLADIARERGQDPLDAFLDLMLDEGHGLCTVIVGTNPQTLPAFVSHPLGMVGSDAWRSANRGQRPNAGGRQTRANARAEGGATEGPVLLLQRSRR